MADETLNALAQSIATAGMDLLQQTGAAPAASAAQQAAAAAAASGAPPTEAQARHAAELAKSEDAKRAEAAAAAQAAAPKPGDEEGEKPPSWTKEQWRDFKIAKKEREHRIKSLEDQIATFKAREPELSELDNLRKSHGELEQKWNKYAAEHTEQFRKEFVAPIEAAKDAVLRAVPAGKRGEMAALLAMPDGEEKSAALDELTEGMSMFKVQSLVAAMGRHDEAVGRKNARLAEAEFDWKAYNSGLQNASKAEQAKAAAIQTGAWNEAMKAARAEIPMFKADADPETKAMATEIEALAKRIHMGQVDPGERAKHALSAALMPVMHAHMKGAMERIAQLEAQLATYKKGLPNPGAGGDGGGSSSGASEPKPGEGFGDAMARMAAAAGLVQR